MSDINLFDVSESEIGDNPDILAKNAKVWTSEKLTAMIMERIGKAKHYSVIAVIVELAEENGLELDEMSTIISSEIKSMIKSEASSIGMLKKTTKSVF